MSSNEEDNNENEVEPAWQGLKKRRIQRACDGCRRKKSDGVQLPQNRCSNCIAYNYDCKYVEAAQKRGPPKGYVEELERKVENLEKLLRRFVPDESVYNELMNSIDKDSDWSFDPEPLTVGQSHSQTPDASEITASAMQIATNAFQHTTNPVQLQSDEDDDTSLILSNAMMQMTLDRSVYRFFGKSSSAMLVNAALEQRQMYNTGTPGPDSIPALKSKRPAFWNPRPWERKTEPLGTTTTIQYVFPEPDLATDLIELYFSRVNLYLPLLHRPTFDKEARENAHHINDGFAAVYLLVCAVGARFSDDPRVLLDGEQTLHSAGWKWFDQVQMGRKSLLTPPTLYDIQFYCLCVQFLQGSSALQSCWTVIGIGVRLAQDVGAHRRKATETPLTAEDEQWKRAFWTLLTMDRLVSAALGRPCAIQDEDFDAELPVDCDDEYWDNGFKQPPNKPSKVTHFILRLKLVQILAFCLRSIYSINKSKILLGFVGPKWEQHIVSELDSALNQWAGSVADHLRWDPVREDEMFFNQSVSLHVTYHHIQILIHRPFIASPTKPSSLTSPSLAICTNAARACSHIVDAQRRRGIPPVPHILTPTFMSGVVLLLSLWSGKRSGPPADPVKQIEDVHKCLNVLKEAEKRWHTGGRFWDVLYELVSLGQLPVPQASKNKRERYSNSESTRSSEHTNYDVPRTIVGSRRFNKGPDARVVLPAPGNQPTPTTQTWPASLHAQHPTAASTHLASSSSTAQTEPSLDQPAATLSQMVFQRPLPLYSNNDLAGVPMHGQISLSTPSAYSYPHLQGGDFWSYPTPSSGQATNSSPGSIIPSSRSSPASLPLAPQTGHEFEPPQEARSKSTSYSAPQRQRRDRQPQAYPQPTSTEMSTMTQGYGSQRAPQSSSLPCPGTDRVVSGDHDAATVIAYPNLRPSSSMFDGIGMMDHTNSIAPQPLGSNMHNFDQPFQPPLAAVPGGQQHQHQPSMFDGATEGSGNMAYTTMDEDMLAMWSNAPTGFELNEWGTFLANMSELLDPHGQQHEDW